MSSVPYTPDCAAEGHQQDGSACVTCTKMTRWAEELLSKGQGITDITIRQD